MLDNRQPGEEEIYHFGIESAILSVLMQNPEMIEVAIARQLSAEHFQNKYTNYLYTCMVKIRERAKVNNRPVCFDCSSMLDTVRKLGKEVEENFVKNAGGLEFLNNLQQNNASNKNSFENYLDSLFQRYLRIQTIRAAARMKELALNEEESSCGELLGSIDMLIDELSKLRTESSVVRLGDTVEEFLRECRDNKGQPTNGLFVSSLPRLMQVLNNLRRKEMLIMFARPKTGKSAFFMNIAENLSCEQNIPVLYIDTEMSVDEQQSRVLAKVSDVSEWHILNGSFVDNPDEKARVEKAEKMLVNAPFYYMKASGYTIEQVIQACEQFVHEHVGYFTTTAGRKRTKPCLIIYDWLKVPENSSSKREKEYQELGDITTKLNDRVAKALDVPILCGAQANRMAASKDATANAADSAQQFLGDSDRILRFCTCLMWLRWVKQEEAEKIAILPKENYFNQMIHVLDQRRGPKHLEGIPLHFIGDRITYIEKDVVDFDKVEEEIISQYTENRNNEREQHAKQSAVTEDIFAD